MKKFLIICLLALSACASSDYSSEKSLCESKPSWVQYAQCLNRIGSTYYSNDPLEHQMITYRNVLIERVQNGQMTEAEAEYMRQQRWMQAKEQANTSAPLSKNWQQTSREGNQLFLDTLKNNRETRGDIKPSKFDNTTTTECHPDGFGGVRCNTY